MAMPPAGAHLTLRTICPFRPALFINGTESFLFVDGHGSFYSTKSIEEYLDATSYPVVEYAYSYPPNVPPGECEWWTMPSYPDRYPWKWGIALP